MLLITRRPGEAIVVNGCIAVKVVDIQGGRVKLGFEFPAGNTVYREELFNKIQAENRAAALSGTPVAGPLPDVLRIPGQPGAPTSNNNKNETKQDAATTNNKPGGNRDD